MNEMRLTESNIRAIERILNKKSSAEVKVRKNRETGELEVVVYNVKKHIED